MQLCFACKWENSNRLELWKGRRKISFQYLITSQIKIFSLDFMHIFLVNLNFPNFLTLPWLVFLPLFINTHAFVTVLNFCLNYFTLFNLYYCTRAWICLTFFWCVYFRSLRNVCEWIVLNNRIRHIYPPSNTIVIMISTFWLKRENHFSIFGPIRMCLLLARNKAICSFFWSDTQKKRNLSQTMLFKSSKPFKNQINSCPYQIQFL